MQNCGNDLTPIIIAVAGILTIQVPLIITAILNGLKARHDAKTIKTLAYDNRAAVSELTLITKNGFHGPPGPPGPTGATGPAASIAAPAPTAVLPPAPEGQ